MLKRTRNGKLDSQDVEALNQRLAMELSISGAINTVIML